MGWENNPSKFQKEFNEKFKEENHGIRECLKCEKEFMSKSTENRLCDKCREHIRNEQYGFGFPEMLAFMGWACFVFLCIFELFFPNLIYETLH